MAIQFYSNIHSLRVASRRVLRIGMIVGLPFSPITLTRSELGFQCCSLFLGESTILRIRSIIRSEDFDCALSAMLDLRPRRLVSCWDGCSVEAGVPIRATNISNDSVVTSFLHILAIELCSIDISEEVYIGQIC